MDILHDDGTSFLVISNGLLMTREKVKRFTKYRYKWFQVSVDGANHERHDSFRQKLGSWDAAIRAVFILNEAINYNTQKYAGRMSVQRSSGTKIQLMRNMNTPNTGAIIRPNGDIRLDCVAPFVIGNVIDEDFCMVWNAKAHDVWGRPEIIEYFNSWEDDEEINHGLKNYSDADVKL